MAMPERHRRAMLERQLMLRCMGLLARIDGYPATACPFPFGSTHAVQWGKGWGFPDPHFKPRTPRCDRCGEKHPRVLLETERIHAKCRTKEEKAVIRQQKHLLNNWRKKHA